MTLLAALVLAMLAVGLDLGATQQAPASGRAPATEAGTPPGVGGVSRPNDDSFPSRYRVPVSRPVLIRNATIMTD